MLKLMNQCEIVDKQRRPYGSIGDINMANPNSNSGSGIFPQNPLSLLSGIIPGKNEFLILKKKKKFFL